MIDKEEQNRLRALGMSEIEIARLILDEMSDAELRFLVDLEKDQHKFNN